MSEILTPQQWLVLDNLRCRAPINQDLEEAVARQALQETIEKGFAQAIGDFDDSPLPARHRITRKGEIALRRSLDHALPEDEGEASP